LEVSLAGAGPEVLSVENVWAAPEISVAAGNSVERSLAEEAASDRSLVVSMEFLFAEEEGTRSESMTSSMGKFLHL